MELANIYGIVCVVLNRQGKILLLKRAPDKKYYPNRWASVAAGPIRFSKNYDELAVKEVQAETGLKGIMLRSAAEVIFYDKLDGQKAEFHITPYVFEVDSDKVTLNHEHTEYRWVNKEELSNYNLIPEGAKIIDGFLDSQGLPINEKTP